MQNAYSIIQEHTPFTTRAFKWVNKYIKTYNIFIFLFAYTGFSKLLAIGSFRVTMAKSDLLRPYSSLLSYIIPITELLIATLLATQQLKIPVLKITTRKLGMYGAFLLMLSFTIYVGYSLGFDKHLPCTCGGIISSMSWKQHLLFNSIFSLLALRSIIHYRRQSQLI